MEKLHQDMITQRHHSSRHLPSEPSEMRSDAWRQARDLQLAQVYKATVEALASAISAKDSFEKEHVRRVVSICELVAGALGLDEDEKCGISIAALVHDIGKLGVPEYVMLKPGPLDSNESGAMRNHAMVGAQILGQVDFPWNVAEMVRHHHEKFDGTGYPDGIAGEQIPIGSLIIAVAEVYDSLVSTRCYRDGWLHEEVVEHIRRLSGSHFDPRVVDAFLEIEPRLVVLTDSNSTGTRCAVEGPAGEHRVAADEIARANRETVSLFEIAETLSSTLEMDEVLALLAHRTRSLLRAATCAVFLVDELHPRNLVAKVAVGRSQEILKGATAAIGRGVTGKAASRASAYAGNFDPNDFTPGLDVRMNPEFKSCAVAPIVSFGTVLGTINLYDTASHAFSRDDLRTLATVASRAALAIQNARAFEQVRDSAMRDPLTGLHNARYMRSHLERELQRAERLGQPLCVLAIDLENFKLVNDSLGHQAGDKVLREAAEIFRAQLRQYDQVARMGGDEFVVLLPDSPAEEAAVIAERIRHRIDSYAECLAGMASRRLGASVGVATFPDDGGDLETLLARADAAMYRDKRARKRGHWAA